MAWNYDMSSAPKGKPVLGLCQHGADPYHVAGTSKLTPYGANCEGLSRVEDGPHVVVWGGGDSDYDEWSGKTIVWPDWWFRAGSEFEEVANPVAWMPIPEPSQ